MSMKQIAAVVAGVMCVNSALHACCMVPVTYKGSIGQKEQEAVLLHANGREELVLRINYQITGAGLPDEFVWVITVPNEPDAYALADPELFEQMFDLAQQLVVPASRSKGARGLTDAIPESVELGERVRIGPYDIQPVRGVGADALDGLNTWLGANGFPTEDPDHMAYFVDRNFTFLCIRITAPEGDDAVGPGGAVKPLHLSFASEKPYYPLKFSSRQGIFDVNLHLLTRGKLDYAASAAALKQISWRSRHYKQNVKLGSDKMPPALKKVLARSHLPASKMVWRYNNIRTRSTNMAVPISTWTDDVFFNIQ